MITEEALHIAITERDDRFAKSIANAAHTNLSEADWAAWQACKWGSIESARLVEQPQMQTALTLALLTR